MTETSQILEREYVIPLRREWQKVPQYRRAPRAAKAIKQFIAKHMKVEDRDLDKVKLDIHLNQELWFRGRTKPPAKIKVKAKKEKGIVRVELAEIPEAVKFARQKVENRQKPVEIKPKEEKEKKEETTEEKKAEKEKETSAAQSKALEAKHESNVLKHTPKMDMKKTHPNRMALEK